MGTTGEKNSEKSPSWASEEWEKLSPEVPQKMTEEEKHEEGTQEQIGEKLG